MTGMHRVTFNLPTDIWHRLKMRARKNNRVLSWEIRSIIEQEMGDSDETGTVGNSGEAGARD